MLAELSEKAAELANQPDASELDEQGNGGAQGSREIPETWQIVASCGSEAQQQEVYELLTAEGISCRLLTA